MKREVEGCLEAFLHPMISGSGSVSLIVSSQELGSAHVHGRPGSPPDSQLSDQMPQQHAK